LRSSESSAAEDGEILKLAQISRTKGRNASKATVKRRFRASFVVVMSAFRFRPINTRNPLMQSFVLGQVGI
jgi:hypothetical protein